MNSLLSKPTNTQALTQVVSPYQLEVARKLSQSMADNQARELLATDILYKVGNLALIQAEILKNNPEVKFIQTISCELLPITPHNT